jgi:hypothetical protein
MTEQDQLRRKLAEIEGWVVSLQEEYFHIHNPDRVLKASIMGGSIVYDTDSAWKYFLHRIMPTLSDLNWLARVEAKVIGMNKIVTHLWQDWDRSWYCEYRAMNTAEITIRRAQTRHEAWAKAIIALHKHLI